MHQKVWFITLILLTMSACATVTHTYKDQQCIKLDESPDHALTVLMCSTPDLAGTK